MIATGDPTIKVELNCIIRSFSVYVEVIKLHQTLCMGVWVMDGGFRSYDI